MIMILLINCKFTLGGVFFHLVKTSGKCLSFTRPRQGIEGYIMNNIEGGIRNVAAEG